MGDEKDKTKKDELVEEPRPAPTVAEADNLLRQALQARDDLKAQLDRKEAMIEREERIRAMEAIKGKTEAGITVAQKEETPQEYAHRMMGVRK